MNNKRILTIDEVKAHNKVNDCWIILYNEVYDITNFMKNEHSGGYIPLSVAGSDATNLFMSTHPSYVKNFLKPGTEFYNKYHIGTLKKNFHKIHNDKLYYELKLEVEDYMKKNKMKARDLIRFDIEILIFLFLTIFTYKKMLTSDNPLKYSILHSLSFVFLLTRTIHDCNHGGLTKNKHWKRYCITFINEIVYPNQSWNEKHNLHHMHTNHIDKDPDINQFLFRFSHKLPKQIFHIFQPIYFIFLYSLFTIYTILGNTFNSKNDPEPYHKKVRVFAFIIKIFYICLPIYYGRLKYLIISHLISGLYLTTIFSVSHAQEHLTDENLSKDSFLKGQLSSTTDYNSGSKFTNFVTHGLNHQVIHHLFPSINYHNYPKLTKDVLIPFCKKHNLKYNGEKESFTSVFFKHTKSLYKWGK